MDKIQDYLNKIWHNSSVVPDADTLVLTQVKGQRFVVYFAYKGHWSEIGKDVIKWCYIKDIMYETRKIN